MVFTVLYDDPVVYRPNVIETEKGWCSFSLNGFRKPIDHRSQAKLSRLSAQKFKTKTGITKTR